MKRRRSSRTADGAAGYRGIESFMPEDERVCYDPFAIDFLGGIYGLAAKGRYIMPIRLLKKTLVWYGEKIMPGMFGYVCGRTRYIDDCLKKCIDDGIEQLVILGAGYDSRAYRFNELRGKIKVFEIDHPATLKVKIGKIKRIFGNLPNHVVYAPVDFDKEKLDERLYENGYDKNLKTLFIWEGVTSFITAEAVDETMAFVAHNSGEGSSIVFDYIFNSVVDGTCDLEEVKKFKKRLERIGEPPTYGIEEGTIDEFLAERGFHKGEEVDAAFLEATYIHPIDPSRQVARHYRLVHATVKPRKGS